jgi:hypothetical protein
MTVAIFILLFLVVPIAMGGWIFLRAARGEDLLARILLSLLPLSASALIYNHLYAVASGALLDWNGAKLAPIVAMTYRDPTSGEKIQHYSLYPDPQEGPMTAWIYGPVPALIFLPSVLGRSPTGMIIVGILINMLCAIGPALWLHLQALPPRRSGMSAAQDELPPERFSATRGQLLGMALLMFLTFMWVCADHESLRRALVMIGPDGPALGLIACSCALVMRRMGRPGRGNMSLALSALCAVLACWSKQSILPFLAVGPVWLFLTDDIRVTARYLAMLAISGVLVTAIILLCFDPKHLWFHMVTISASHHFQDNDHGNIVALWYGMGELLADCAVAGAMLLVLIAAGAMSGLLPGAISTANRLARWRRWLRANPWTLLLITSLVLVPSSVLGYVKIGGYYNNFALTHYFLLASATVGMIWWWPRFASAALARVLGAAAAVWCLGAPLLQMSGPGQISAMYTRIANFKDNPQETILRYDKQHEDVIYFPWNNLSTLLATGHLYHFEWGIYDRREAKMTISPEQIRRHLPQRLMAVGFSPLHQSEYALGLFPKARTRVAVDDLPGFVIYVEPPPAEPREASPFRQPGAFDLSPTYPSGNPPR